MIGERREILADGVGRRLPAPRSSASGSPRSAASTACARFGVAAMPPKATRASLIRPPSIFRQNAREHGGNVFVEALADLVGAEMRRPRASFGTRSRRTNSPGRAVLLAIGEEEVFQRQGAHLARRAAAPPWRPARSAPARDRRSASRWRCCRRPCRWRAPAWSRTAAAIRRGRDRSIAEHRRGARERNGRADRIGRRSSLRSTKAGDAAEP